MYQERAINKFKTVCTAKASTGVFTGHSMFWQAAADAGKDIQPEHVRQHTNIISADSVANDGETALQFRALLKALQSDYERVVVVVGVVHSGAVADDVLIAQAMARYRKLSVGIRLSTNKVTGKGTADTRNRLLNTPHIIWID